MKRSSDEAYAIAKRKCFFYTDSTLYFSVMSRDCMTHLRRFTFDTDLLQRVFTISGNGATDLTFDLNDNILASHYSGVCIYSCKDGALLRKIDVNNVVLCLADKNGRIYVSQNNSNSIKVFDTYETSFDIGTKPWGMSVIDDNLYVGTANGLKIVNTITGCLIGQLDQYNYATRVLAATKKQVVAWKNEKLCIFDCDGTIVRLFGEFDCLTARIAVYDDTIHVVDKKHYHVFSSSGVLLGKVIHAFSTPRCIAVSSTLLIVADRKGIHLSPRFGCSDWWLALTNPDNYPAGGIHFAANNKQRPRDCLSITDHTQYTASCALSLL